MVLELTNLRKLSRLDSLRWNAPDNETVLEMAWLKRIGQGSMSHKSWHPYIIF